MASFNPNRPWIVGPCSIESCSNFLASAEFLVPCMAGRRWYLKGSFDKANRTSITGSRGPLLPQAIEVFAEVKKRYPHVLLMTDVHETSQVERLVGVVDAIQIPAFLCRQTDLLVECGVHFDCVNVKKGQFVDPSQTAFFAEKVRSRSPKTRVWICDRGTTFGYGNLVLDFRAAGIMKDFCDELILDCTHSTQCKKGDFTSGDRELAERFMMASAAFEYTGLFLETHLDPPNAISDADCQIEMQRLPGLLARFDAVESILSNPS